MRPPLTAGTGEADDKSGRSEYCLTDPEKVAEVTMWFFAGGIVVILIVSYVIGPVTLMELVLGTVVPQNPGWITAMILGSLVATLMIVPVPLVLMVLPIPGMIFGFWKGYLVVFCGVFIGSTVAFAVGQNVLQDPIRRFVAKGKYERLERALKVLETDEDSFVLLVCFRFLGMPFVARNFTVTILDIPFWKLTLSAIPHHLWVSFVFTSFGLLFKDTADLVRKGGSMGWTNLKWQQVAPPIVALIGSVLVAMVAYRIYQRAETQSVNQPSSSAPLLGSQGA